MLLDRVNSAMDAVESFHVAGDLLVKATNEAADELIVATFEGVGKSNGDSRVGFVMTIKSNLFSATFTLETREVDGTSYRQNPFTKEWEVDEAGDTTEADPFGPLESDLPDLENMVVETDSLAGEPVYRITGAVPDDPEVEQVVLWVGIDDLLVRQMRMEGNVPAIDFEGLVPDNFDELFMSILISFSKFNEPVEIVAPQVKPKPASTASLSDAVMAETVDPISSEPLEITDTFTPETAQIYVVFQVSAPAGTEISSQWVLVGGEDGAYGEIAKFSWTPFAKIETPIWMHFYLDRSDQAWPVGSYQVSLLLDGEEVQTLLFKVGALTKQGLMARGS